jgi:CheY-like chemotaxis protein
MFDTIQCFRYLHSSGNLRKIASRMVLPVVSALASSLPQFHKNQRARLFVMPFRKPLLLLVEDDPIYLSLRKDVLQAEGYNVIGVTSKEHALQALHEAPICCTIADHMLNGQTGAKLVKTMKRLRPDVPIILYSGSPPNSMEGVDVYINKGEPTATFLKLLKEVIERFYS